MNEHISSVDPGDTIVKVQLTLIETLGRLTYYMTTFAANPTFLK